jgi:hypothetical protein
MAYALAIFYAIQLINGPLLCTNNRACSVVCLLDEIWFPRSRKFIGVYVKRYLPGIPRWFSNLQNSWSECALKLDAETNWLISVRVENRNRIEKENCLLL